MEINLIQNTGEKKYPVFCRIPFPWEPRGAGSALFKPSSTWAGERVKIQVPAIKIKIKEISPGLRAFSSKSWQKLQNCCSKSVFLSSPPVRTAQFNPCSAQGSWGVFWRFGVLCFGFFSPKPQLRGAVAISFGCHRLWLRCGERKGDKKGERAFHGRHFCAGAQKNSEWKGGTERSPNQ